MRESKFIKDAAILMTAVFLALQAAGCGAVQEASEAVEETAGEASGEASADISMDISMASEHLLTVWYDYLKVLDKMYASQIWALDYVADYLESGDWNDLTKARTACIASSRYLTELSMTEEDLTEEEYRLLADAGIDTGYQTITFQSVEGALEEAHRIIRERMLEGLESEVFDKNMVELLRKEAAVRQEYISCMCRYTANQTNYLFVTLEEAVDSEAAWTYVQEAYPALFEEYGEWIESEAQLKALADACLDEYEDIVLKQAELVSMLEADLYRMTQIIRNNDIEALLEAAYPMENLPDLLPMPVWYNPMQTGYLSFTSAQDGSVAYPESGDELADVIYSMYIQAENVSVEDITTYLAYVQNDAEHVWKAQEGDIWYIKMPSYNVSIEWAENTATILFNGADVTFAPDWYIGLQ